MAIEYDPKYIFESGNYTNADKDVVGIASKKLSDAAKKGLGLIKDSKRILKMMKQ